MEDPPTTLWLPCLLDADSDQIIHEAGAFASEVEAEKVLAIWRAEGRTEPMAVNIVPFHDSSDDWYEDR